MLNPTPQNDPLEESHYDVLISVVVCYKVLWMGIFGMVGGFRACAFVSCIAPHCSLNSYAIGTGKNLLKSL